MILFKTANNIIGTVSLSATTFAAATFNEWPPYVAGAALGTLAFLWSIKGAAEDKRYKALLSRLEDSEADIDAARNDRDQITEFYGKRIDEIEAKYRSQIADLEQAKLHIMLELQEAHARAKRDIAIDASMARTMVAVEAAAAKTVVADAAK